MVSVRSEPDECALRVDYRPDPRVVVFAVCCLDPRSMSGTGHRVGVTRQQAASGREGEEGGNGSQRRTASHIQPPRAYERLLLRAGTNGARALAWEQDSR